MSKKKKNRKGTATEAEMQRRKRQHDSNFETEEKPMAKAKVKEEETEEEDLTTSEEYEALANDALTAEGGVGAAQVLATLALMATLRESVFIIAEILDPSEDEDGEDEDNG